MRIGLLSDIHGNFTALAAVLENMNEHPVDALICLGDVVTIGPQPKQVLERLQELDCTFIMGNHDSALLDLTKISHYQIAANLTKTVEWCAQKLEPGDMDFLRSFKPYFEMPLGNHLSLLCYHGSPRSNTDQVLATTPAQELDRLFEGHNHPLLAGGHTHIQMLRQHESRLIINPGSVGSSFKAAARPGIAPVLLPWAEYGIIELMDGTLRVDLRRVPFDMNEFTRTVKESDLPAREIWLDMYG